VKPGGYVALELGYKMDFEVARLFSEFTSIAAEQDLSAIPRCLVVQK
jgi:hypothetical protein